MLRGIGGGMILAGCLGLGISYRVNLMGRIRLLQQLTEGAWSCWKAKSGTDSLPCRKAVLRREKSWITAWEGCFRR